MPPRWTNPTVQMTFSISGGYLTRPMPVQTTSMSAVHQRNATKSPAVACDTTEDGIHRLADVFVKLDKSFEWMVKAVGGPKAQRGFLSRTTLVETLRAHMLRDSIAPPPSAVANGDDPDPMAALCNVDGEMDTPQPKRKYTRKRKGMVMEVDMPQCEPTRHPNCDSRKKVRLLGLSTNQVWLSLADVPWLLQWLVDAVSTSGVPVLHDAALTANSPAVAGVNFKWDFEDSWEAMILMGPQTGTMIRTSVSKFTEDKLAIVDLVHKYGVSFADTTYEQKKAATLHYLEHHCKRMLDTSYLNAP